MAKKKQAILGEMCKRFAQIRIEFNMTQEEFGEFVGMGQAGVSSIESEATNPSLDTIKILCDKTGLSYNWLFLGKGEKYLKNDTNLKNYDDNIKMEYFEIIKRETQEIIEKRAKEEKFRNASQNAI